MSAHGFGILAIAISLTVHGYAANPLLNAKADTPLARFERDAFNQIVVAMFPKMQSQNDIVGYAQHAAESDSIRTPIGTEHTATDKAVGQEHHKLNVLWLLLFFGVLV